MVRAGDSPALEPGRRAFVSGSGTGTGGKSGLAAVKRSQATGSRIAKAPRVRRERRSKSWRHHNPDELPRQATV